MIGLIGIVILLHTLERLELKLLVLFVQLRNLEALALKVRSCTNKTNNLNSRGSKVCNYTKKTIKPILKESWRLLEAQQDSSKTL